MDQRTIIFIAAVVLIMFAASLAAGAKRLFVLVRNNLPTLPSPTGLFTAKFSIEWWKAGLILLAGWFFLGGATWQGCDLKLPTDWRLPSFATNVKSAVYVYEKDSGGVPAFVGSAIGKLNDRGIIATTHEDDSTNKTGGVPKQYEFAVPAARTAGLPSFVTMAKDRKVIRTVKDPRTGAAVLEAVP